MTAAAAPEVKTEDLAAILKQLTNSFIKAMVVQNATHKPCTADEWRTATAGKPSNRMHLLQFTQTSHQELQCS